MAGFFNDIIGKKSYNLEDALKNSNTKDNGIMTGVTLLSNGELDETCLKQYPNLVVVLDPGHAKTTSGKKSPYSLGRVKTPKLALEEWEFARDIVSRIKVFLEMYGIEVFVTTDEGRDGDTDLGLTKRAQRGIEFIKNSGKKGIFISVHADADGNGDKWTTARGWSCFTTKGDNISDNLAECLYDAAEEILPNYGLRIRTDKKDGDRDWEENFTVIYKTEQLSLENEKPTVPAVLTENLFYTNTGDCEFQISEEGKNEIVNIHLNGILRFAEKEYKM